jgi:hypothetical protein
MLLPDKIVKRSRTHPFRKRCTGGGDLRQER